MPVSGQHNIVVFSDYDEYSRLPAPSIDPQTGKSDNILLEWISKMQKQEPLTAQQVEEYSRVREYKEPQKFEEHYAQKQVVEEQQPAQHHPAESLDEGQPAHVVAQQPVHAAFVADQESAQPAQLEILEKRPVAGAVGEADAEIVEVTTPLTRASTDRSAMEGDVPVAYLGSGVEGEAAEDEEEEEKQETDEDEDEERKSVSVGDIHEGSDVDDVEGDENRKSTEVDHLAGEIDAPWFLDGIASSVGDEEEVKINIDDEVWHIEEDLAKLRALGRLAILEREAAEAAAEAAWRVKSAGPEEMPSYFDGQPPNELEVDIKPKTYGTLPAKKKRRAAPRVKVAPKEPKSAFTPLVIIGTILGGGAIAIGIILIIVYLCLTHKLKDA